MNKYISIVLLFVAFATASAQTPLETSQKTADLLSKMIVPKIETKEAPLKDVLAFCQQKGRELNPDLANFTIVIDPSAKDAGKLLLTLELANIPESELLKYIASLSGLKVTIEGTTARFLAADAK